MGSRSRRVHAQRQAAIAVAMVLMWAVPATAAPAWSLTPSPNPIGAQRSYLDAVSCTGPTTAVRCFAVGSYITTQGVVKTLIERWNGTKWTVVASPNRVGAIANSLVGVTCTSPTNCFAVGNSQATPTSPAMTLIERWNGTNWTIVPSPNPANATGSFLHAVSCVGSGRCFAVGNYKSNGTAGSTLTERWTGSAWVIAPSPNKAGAATNTLDGVSCVPAGAGMSCFAVGSWETSSGSAFFTLTERWTGTGWTVVPSPNVGGQYKTALNSVSCTSPSSCIAVGVWHHSPGASVSERWNGTAWKIVNVSNFPGWTFSQLNSVSCTSATSCVAVGSWSNGTPVKTLVEQWNGVSWVPISSPNPTGSRGSSLVGVSCVGAKCTAVGSAQKPPTGAAATLVERNF